jgi:hypothetical protein
MCKNRLLKTEIGIKRRETAGWRKLHKEELHGL